MGNCAGIQVGSYVETCEGKPCSPACPNNPCANPGYVCNNGICNQSVIATADCSLISNMCTASCIDKASCQQCPSKPGCFYTGNQCSPGCFTGEYCDAGVCKKIVTTVPAPTGCVPACRTGEICYEGLCTKTIIPDPCASKPCSAVCTYGSCPTGQLCMNGKCTVSVPPEYDEYGCDKAIGQTYCAAQMRCHIESEDPCVPIVPVGGIYPPGVVKPGAQVIAPAGSCDGLNRNGSFDYTCLMEGQNSLMLIIGIALLGGVVLMAGRK